MLALLPLATPFGKGGATEAPAPTLLRVIQPVLGGRAGTGVARPEDKKEKKATFRASDGLSL